MSLQRIDEMTEPPVEGQRYLVPCVRAKYMHLAFHNWPVIGPKHNDREFFNFEQMHYHVDGRFIAPRTTRSLELVHHRDEFERVLAGYPLMMEIAEIVWRPRRCWRTDATWHYEQKPALRYDLAEAFAGRVCERDERGGLVCPHRGARIGSLVPHDGIVRCPLHGLLINVTTGVVGGAS